MKSFPSYPSAAKRCEPPADALDPGRALEDGRFREPEFRAEKKAAAVARAARDDARAAVDLGAALGDERHSRLSLVSFPAGALTQFAAGIAGVLAPPSGARAPTRISPRSRSRSLRACGNEVSDAQMLPHCVCIGSP